MSSFEGFLTRMVGTKPVNILIRHFDDIRSSWKDLAKQLMDLNNRLIACVDETWKTEQTLFVFGI